MGPSEVQPSLAACMPSIVADHANDHNDMYHHPHTQRLRDHWDLFLLASAAVRTMPSTSSIMEVGCPCVLQSC